MLKTIKYGGPVVCLAASIAFFEVGCVWASGFAAGSFFFMVNLIAMDQTT